MKNKKLASALIITLISILIGLAYSTTVFDAGGNELSGLGEPSASDDVATKSYVDSNGGPAKVYKSDGATELGTLVWQNQPDCDDMVYATSDGTITSPGTFMCETQYRELRYLSTGCAGAPRSKYCGSCNYITNYGYRLVYSGTGSTVTTYSIRTDSGCSDVTNSGQWHYSTSTSTARTCGLGECTIK